jgi:ferrous iron transport protein A
MMLRLDQLPFRTPAIVTAIDWAALSDAEALRLRNLGLDEGVAVEALHAAPFGRDPIAVRIGRMTLALRRVHLRVITVIPGNEAAASPAESPIVMAGVAAE